MLFDPDKQPVLKPEDIFSLLPLSRASVYQALKQGDIPSIRVGRKILIPTAAFLRFLEVDADAAKTTAEADSAEGDTRPSVGGSAGSTRRRGARAKTKAPTPTRRPRRPLG